MMPLSSLFPTSESARIGGFSLLRPSSSPRPVPDGAGVRTLLVNQLGLFQIHGVAHRRRTSEDLDAPEGGFATDEAFGEDVE
jgi:hypothetical protein